MLELSAQYSLSRLLARFYISIQCSASCGNGVKSRRVKCYSEQSNKLVPSYFCSTKKKPRRQKKCQIRHCPYKWVVDQWSQVNPSVSHLDHWLTLARCSVCFPHIFVIAKRWHQLLLARLLLPTFLPYKPCLSFSLELLPKPVTAASLHVDRVYLCTFRNGCSTLQLPQIFPCSQLFLLE